MIRTTSIKAQAEQLLGPGDSMTDENEAKLVEIFVDVTESIKKYQPREITTFLSVTTKKVYLYSDYWRELLETAAWHFKTVCGVEEAIRELAAEATKVFERRRLQLEKKSASRNKKSSRKAAATSQQPEYDKCDEADG